MAGLETEESKDYVEKKLKTDGDKTEGEKIGKSLKSILADFDVMPYLIGFVIALSFNKLVTALVKYVSSKFFKAQNDLVEASIEFIMTIALLHLFIYQIYYKYLVDDDISKEKIVKTAINEAKVEEAKKEINDDPDIKKKIEDDIELETFDKFRLFTKP
jgi:hypothetical protein